MRHFTAVFRSGDGEITKAKRAADDRIRYGGAWVTAASALPLNANAVRPRPVARLAAAALRRPQRLAAMIALWLRTPTERVVLSETSTGRVLSEYFSQRAMGILPRKRFFRGMLLLPEDHAAYVGGRHRKTLRRNLRRAAAGGVRCEVMNDRRHALEDITQVLREHPCSLDTSGFHTVIDRVRATAQRPETTIIVGRDAHGEPVAILTCVIDDTVCLITSAVAICREPRWAVHDHLVRLLISRRVRYLLGDGEGPFGALAYPPSVQHYQHLLGYELRHVAPAFPRRTTLRRRLVATVVLLAATIAVAVPRAAARMVEQTTAHPALQAADRSAGLRYAGEPPGVSRSRLPT
jgi:hypothetical protein